MRLRILIITLVLPLFSFSQADSIPYTRDYEFKEGLYLTFGHFMGNVPIQKPDIISSYSKNETDFLSQVVSQKVILYKDQEGKEQKIPALSLWGYCQNHTIYINFNNEFVRLSVIGTLCHFTATVYNKVGYEDPMDTNYGINTTSELRQFVFDTQSNKILDFSVKNMEMLLEADPELSADFAKLKKRQKADSIFIYLRKFNEKHQLYLAAK